MPKKKSKQSQSNQQEIVELKSPSSSQLEESPNSSEVVDQKAEIIELEPGSSSQTEQTASSSEVVEQKTEIIELKSASSSQREPSTEKTQQLTNSPNILSEQDTKNSLISLVNINVNSTTNNQQTNDNSITLVNSNVKPIANSQEPDKIPKPKPAIKLKKFQKKESSPPPYKNLETATNQNGETFVVREKIKINTCNFGEYTVEIKFLYETADGSIWVTYYPFGSEDQKHPWRRGCQRLELLRKTDSQEVN